MSSEPAVSANDGAWRWLFGPAAWFGRLIIRGYQIVVSPCLGPACRFEPSCSRYAMGCLETLPFPRALGLIVRRILRCHPWGGQGFDPVPERARMREMSGEGAHGGTNSEVLPRSVVPLAGRAQGADGASREEDSSACVGSTSSCCRNEQG